MEEGQRQGTERTERPCVQVLILVVMEEGQRLYNEERHGKYLPKVLILVVMEEGQRPVTSGVSGATSAS